MRRFDGNIEAEESENAKAETNEYETDQQRHAHFESAYRLRPNEQYEVNHYSYETDRYGRIKRCEGTLRLEEGKRNTHQKSSPLHEIAKQSDSAKMPFFPGP